MFLRRLRWLWQKLARIANLSDSKVAKDEKAT